MGTLLASQTIPTTVDYQGVISTGAIPGYVSWLGATFNSGYNFNYLNSGNDWSWTYATPHNGTWVNGGTGSSGDIVSSSLFVAPSGNDSNIGSQASPYKTIQAAINAAHSGDTINMAAGTYTEIGQIVINKNLTIVGADKATTIIKPNFDTASSGDARGWFLVQSGKTFNLSNVTLDGSGHKINTGIRDFGSGTINNVVFTHIQYEGNGPAYSGFGVAAYGTNGIPVSVNITNSSFDNIGRVGVQFYGPNETGTLDHNVYVGKGAVDGLDYATDVGNGAHVNITNNNISGNLGVASIDGSTSAGIIVTTYWGAGTSATITGNTVTGNTDGIVVGYDASDTSTVTAHKNNLTGNAVTGITSTHSTVDATNNWWGVASPSFSTLISGDVNYTPWYINNELTTLSSNVPTNATYTSPTNGQADLPNGATDVVLTNGTTMDLSGGVASSSGGNIVVGGVTQDLTSYNGGDLAGFNLDTAQTVGDQQVTVDQAVTLQSGTNGDPIVLTNSNVSNVSVSIPDGTTILAPAGWDGTIDPPKAGDSSGTAPSGFSVGSTVDVGSPDVVLLFDKPVTVTLTGVTGDVGYKSTGSDTWITISTICTGTYDNPTGATFPGECKITNGTDTKILTYHFTTFGGLNVVPQPVSGGGNGPGLTGIPVVTAPVPTSTPAPTLPQGQVLGAAITKGDPANLTANGLKEGDAVSARGAGDPDVYVVNQFGYKRLFLNPVIFNMYGQLKNIWGKVRSIVAQTRDSFPTSELFRNCETNDQKVYAMETTGEDTAVLHWVNITGDQAVAQDPEFFKKVFCINSKEFNWYPKSSTDFTALSQVPMYSR